ncbi:MAG: OmpH family outer membrane protein [Phycisphaerales bacterium]|nr:OmpH family outer membrane protein [Phycisphaerales bacterium]
MKKFILPLLLVLATTTVASAQKYCIIDSKYILEKVPEYKAAQSQLDMFSKNWQAEVDNKMKEVDRMYKGYQAERAMLNDDMRKNREEDIMNKEKAAKDLQKQYFGYEGELFKKRQELVKPVQDKVYNAVQKMAVARGYDLVLDKAGGVTMFYADPKLDRSDEVLKSLAISK